MMLLYVALLFLPLASEVNSNHNGGRYGCIFTPSVCVPPEDCNRVTGYCQTPARQRGRSFDGDLEALKQPILRALNSYKSYDAPESSNVEYNNRHLKRPEPRGGRSAGNHDMHALVDTNRADSIGQIPDAEIRKKLNKEEIHQHVVELLDKVQDALAKKGKSLKDLSEDEMDMLVEYLANVIRKDQIKLSNHVHDTANESNRGIFLLSRKQDSNIMPNAQQSVYSSQQDSKKSTNFHDSDVSDITIEEIPSKRQDTGTDLEVKEQIPVLPKTAKASHFSTSSSSTNSSKIQKDTLYIVLIIVGATVILIVLVTIISCIYYARRRKKQQDIKFLESMTNPSGDDYEDLCRQRYANENSEIDAESNLIDEDYQGIASKPLKKRSMPSSTEQNMSRDYTTRNSSVSSVSWSEEPVTANLDITTAHVLLSYMEDHLKLNRLDEEWEEICNYEADNVTMNVANSSENSLKNFSNSALPYDCNRVKLSISENHVGSDYINASKIIDNDRKRPLYIAAQGPLLPTVSDFWQMIWEQGCVSIVMLTALIEEGVSQCVRYWPAEGSCSCHNFEIHLVSEHIWCDDYLVRSLYLKHSVTGETRTVTLFHFLSWPKDSVPSTPKPLLELRRKVTKCSKTHSSPVLVHCSDGVGRTGTYILLDLAINRMLKGAKEIDIAATLEHIRDQRAGMVANKEQFEFALTAVADEVNAILKTLRT